MTLTEWLKATKGTFTDQVGLNRERLFQEFDALAKKLGIGEGDELTDAYIKQAKALYEAYITAAMANVVELGLSEILALFVKGRVPRRKRRSGASTA